MASLTESAASGDRRATLEALRDRLAVQIDHTASGRDVAALAGRLTEILDKLAALPAPAEGTPLDELRKRRTARGAGAARPARAAVGGK